MKCEICKQDIEKTFLDKIIGTVVKDKEGKTHFICNACQKTYGNDKKKIISGLGK